MNKLDYKNGWLCIRYTIPAYDKPEMLVTWWPICRASMTEAAEWIGLEAHDFGSGTYAVRVPGTGFDRKFYLMNGGSTTPIANSADPFPAPKVRKGIQLRYNYGRWQKYLKSEGWVTA